MIRIGNDGCGRVVPPDFQRRLDEFNRARGDRFPLKLVWNPKGRVVRRRYVAKDGTLVNPVYEPRWEIWVRWDDNSHPLNRGTRKKDTRLGPDGALWVRNNVWEWEDRSYADPFSEVFFRAARIADSFRDTQKSGAWGHYYDLHGTDQEVYDEEKQKLVAPILAATVGSQEYLRSLDNPIVGRHFSSGWRHRLPHR